MDATPFLDFNFRKPSALREYIRRCCPACFVLVLVLVLVLDLSHVVRAKLEQLHLNDILYRPITITSTASLSTSTRFFFCPLLGAFLMSPAWLVVAGFPFLQT